MSEFSDFLTEQFGEFGQISVKRMFGGEGLFYDGLMIGLVANDVLYLKTDKQSESHFLTAGSQPFMYDKAGKLVKMSYFEAPPETLDDPDAMKEWAQLAYEAALRNKR